MRSITKHFFITLALMMMIVACKPEKIQPKESNSTTSKSANKASTNASWQGILSSNKAEFQAKMDTI